MERIGHASISSAHSSRVSGREIVTDRQQSGGTPAVRAAHPRPACRALRPASPSERPIDRRVSRTEADRRIDFARQPSRNSIPRSSDRQTKSGSQPTLAPRLEDFRSRRSAASPQRGSSPAGRGTAAGSRRIEHRLLHPAHRDFGRIDRRANAAKAPVACPICNTTGCRRVEPLTEVVYRHRFSATSNPGILRGSRCPAETAKGWDERGQFVPARIAVWC